MVDLGPSIRGKDRCLKRGHADPPPGQRLKHLPIGKFGRDEPPESGKALDTQGRHQVLEDLFYDILNLYQLPAFIFPEHFVQVRGSTS
jgi:hypothetical protein